jgi:hypothetical protein
MFAFTTCAEVKAKEVTDYNGLLESIKETLVHFGTAEALPGGALLLPVFDKMPTCPQKVPGYGGNGWFNPAMLGAACLIGKEGTPGLIKTDNSEAKVVFNPGSSPKEIDGVAGLRQTHCSFKPREGQPKRQFEFTPYKFELINFLLGAGLFLVVNMLRTWSTPPKTDTQATTAGVATTPTAAPALLSSGGLFSSDEYPEDASAMDKILHEIGVLLQTESFRCSRNEKEIGETDTRVRALMQHLAIGREEGHARAEAEALQARQLRAALQEAESRAAELSEQLETAGATAAARVACLEAALEDARRASDALATTQTELVQQLTIESEEAQRQLAAEREGRARAEAAARQATDRAQAAEVPQTAPSMGHNLSSPRKC